jgi:hypothetical protein
MAKPVVAAKKARGRPAKTDRVRKPDEHAVSIEDALARPDDVKSVRLQMLFRPSYAKTLHDLKELTNASSYTDVVRAALDNYTKQIVSVKRGARILIERPNGEREVLLDDWRT